MNHAVVRFTLPLAALLPVLGGCAAHPSAVAAEMGETPAGYGMVETPASGPLGGFPAHGAPIGIPGQEVDLVPYIRTETKWWISDSDHFDEGGRSALGTRHESRDVLFLPVRWHNAVFRDRASGDQRALLDKRAVISKLWAVLDGPKRDPRATALLFAVTDEDTNGDGVLNDKDAARVLVTGPAGESPRYVSPERTQLDDLSVSSDGTEAVLMLREDADGDGRYEASELPVAYLLNLESEAPARRLVDQDLERSMDALLR